MTAIPKIKLESVERFERDYKLRLPFRFGVITVTAGHAGRDPRHASRSRTGARHVGVAAEALAAKWFDKSPAFSDAQNLDQLRQSLALAIELYRARGLEHAVRPLCRRLCATSWRAAPSSGWCRWWPPMARRCSTAPSSMRWGARWACPSPT